MIVPATEENLGLFNRLIGELLSGRMTRNGFHQWEITLLLDMEQCHIRRSMRRETLRRYQRAVHRAVERGSQQIMFLSEYLETKQPRRGAPVTEITRLAS